MAYPNWGLGSEMANGIKEGLIAYQTNKQIQRQNQMQDLMQGIQRDPETGETSFTPLKQQQMQLQQQQSQRGLLNLDPSSQVSAAKRQIYSQQIGKPVDESLSGADIDESMKMIAPGIHNLGLIGVQGMKGQTAQDIQGQKSDTSLESARIAADARVKAAQQGLGLRQENMNERVHGQQLKAINNDKTLNDLQTSHANLKNAIQLFQEGGATPQEFAELQQAVRANLGIKGSSGVGEREATRLGSLGISADSVKQFLSGNPQSVLESDPKLAHQIIGLAQMEMKNKENQAGQQLERLQSGRGSFYKKQGNEGRAQDIKNTVQQRREQFGLVGKPAQSAFQPLQGEHPQDQAALDWATANKNDPRAQVILRAHGM